MQIRTRCECFRRVELVSQTALWFPYLRLLGTAALITILCSHELEAAGSRATVVSAGDRFTCAVTTEGEVRCWGDNWFGQVGSGEIPSYYTLAPLTQPVPQRVSGLEPGAVAVVTGYGHACALLNGGGVRCWGYNNAGQLGDGTTTSRPSPVPVIGLPSDVVALSAGDYGSCALAGSGAVWCWGKYSGDGTTNNRWTPVPVIGLPSDVVAVSAGGFHTCALTSGGAVWCWGYNNSGELGDGTTTDRLAPVPVVGLPSDVVAVSAGGFHTCALAGSGAVWCWGYNEHGELGDGTVSPKRLTPASPLGLTSGVQSISAGTWHTCALMTDGTAKCWGWKLTGALGDGIIADAPGDVPVLVEALPLGVVAIDAGGSHTCGRTRAGALLCWGSNGSGQIGDGTEARHLVPALVAGTANPTDIIAAGYAHTCAASGSGTVSCWGANGDGQLGDGTTTQRLTPVSVSGLPSDAVAVSAGGFHTCALMGSGGVWCWGSNANGQLGDGTMTTRLTPVPVIGLQGGVVAIADGYTHTCALTQVGGVLCWGNNLHGQLGNGTTEDQPTPVPVTGLHSGIVAIAAGALHTCALTQAGGMTCWGYDLFGQLGDGTTTDSSTPVVVSGLATGVRSLALGYYHTCAVTIGGGALCWGQDTGSAVPVPVVGLSSGVSTMAAGEQFTCAVTARGGAQCWGHNECGQLGNGRTQWSTTPTQVAGLTSGVDAVAAGDRHACVRTTTGSVMCWGWSGAGQVGDGTPGVQLSIRVRGFGTWDFDGDGQTDMAVYRPSAGTWFSLDSSTANTSYRYRGWGVQAEGDQPVMGDFDGDGVLDPTVFRPGTGTWFILKSRENYTTWSWFGWGTATDMLVAADYDGDGKTDAAVYRPSTGEWFMRPSSGAAQWSVVFGQSGDVPLAADLDGDGRPDVAVYRASSGTWFWLTSSSNYTQMAYRGWGVQAEGDVPVPGDYDGDGKTDLAVYRPASGTWFILESHAAYMTWAWFGWGTATDALVPADYDGDGKTDAAVYRPSTGEWFIKPSNGATPWRTVFGQVGDIPLQGIR